MPHLSAEREPWAASPEVMESLDLIGVEGSDQRLEKLSPGPGRSAAAVARHQRARLHRATIELIAEKGHDAVGVRAIIRKARISTKAFYQRYPSKLECLLRVQELVAQRALNSLTTAQAESDGREERIRGGVTALLKEWSADARAAHVMLFAGESADPVIRSCAQRAMRTIALGFGNGVDRDGEVPTESARLIDRGIVAGLVGIARWQLLEGRLRSLARLSDELGDWAVALRADDSALKDLDSLLGARRRESSVAVPRDGVTASDCRALLLVAMSRLVVTRDVHSLTPDDVFSLAGLRKRDFFAHFSSIGECLGATIEFRLGRAIAVAARAGESEESPPDRAYRVIADLCNRIAADPSLAGLCLEDGAIAPSTGLRTSEWRVGVLRRALGAAGLSGRETGDGSALEASLAAMWGVLRDRVAAERGAELTAFAPILGYLVLAPTWGVEAASEAISSDLTTCGWDRT